MKNLFAETPPAEREAMLKEMATKSELQSVRRFYGEEEKHQMKDYLSTETIGLLEQKDAFKEIKKEFNKVIAEHNKQIVKVAKDLKQGYSEQSETVYGVADQERDMMDFYDARGEFLNSRRLLPEERQVTMLHMDNSKSGTHD